MKLLPSGWAAFGLVLRMSFPAIAQVPTGPINGNTSNSLDTSAIGQTMPETIGGDTVIIPQDFALKRVVDLEVTQMGLVLDLGSPITSVNLSHMSNVVFTGLDGALCDHTANCPDTNPPTTLLLRRIPPIQFKNALPSPDGTRMLFVSTSSGLYRFRLKPVTGNPKHTSVQIQPAFPASAFPNAITR